MASFEAGLLSRTIAFDQEDDPSSEDRQAADRHSGIDFRSLRDGEGGAGQHRGDEYEAAEKSTKVFPASESHALFPLHKFGETLRLGRAPEADDDWRARRNSIIRIMPTARTVRPPVAIPGSISGAPNAAKAVPLSIVEANAKLAVSARKFLPTAVFMAPRDEFGAMSSEG